MNEKVKEKCKKYIHYSKSDIDIEVELNEIKSKLTSLIYIFCALKLYRNKAYDYLVKLKQSRF